MNHLPVIISALAVVTSLVTLLWNVLSKSGERLRLMTAALGQVQERCTLLEMKMGMFWKLVEEHLSGLLKRPTHQVMDALLDKLANHTLTLPEAHHLRALLAEAYLDQQATQAHNRVVAILVVAAVDALIHELEFQQS